SAVPDARRVALGAENLLELARIVRALIGEADAFPALELGRHCLPAVRAEPKEERILLQQSALNVIPADRVDDSLDAPARCPPDLCRSLGAVAPHQLMQLELAVGREKPCAAT